MKDASLTMQDASLPAAVAQLCDTIRLNGTTDDPADASICQGWVYASVQKIAWFKGQRVNQTIDTAKDLCFNPNRTTWLLNAGQLAHKCLLCACLCPEMSTFAGTIDVETKVDVSLSFFGMLLTGASN